MDTRDDDGAGELADLFIRTARRLRHEASQNLAPSGVTPAQARALKVIAHAPGDLKVVELAEALGVVPRSATAVVDALEDRGLIDRLADPDDRRAVRIRLTEAGHARVAEVRRRRREAAADLLRRLDAGDRAALRRLLSRLQD
ncbi:MAG: MarR family transcriptional regulator [Alphaproteobacteria bacterium]|nr:MarR family transcriptional regulator [Alphaproteobacteria bacterium]